MKVLHLNLYRKYFDAILKGDKVVEYRDITPYWSKRLEGRHYDIIQFRNGYAKVAPTMKVEYKIETQDIQIFLTWGQHHLLFQLNLQIL